MDKERHQEFVALWNQDVPIKEISEQLGMSTQNVTMYANRHREECPIRKKHFDKELIIKLWDEGLQAKEIAEKIGVQTESIFAYIGRNREEFPYRQKNFSSKHKKIIEMWREGKTAKEISEEIGMSKNGVVLFIQRHRDECGYHNYTMSVGYDEEMIIKLWNEGARVSKIAEQVGISDSTVASFVKRNRDKCPVRWTQKNK